MSERHALPGWAVDLIAAGASPGVGRSTLNRADVVTATRRVMLSAHRANWQFSDAYNALTDTRSSRLAKQINTGRGGRAMPPKARNAFLLRHWQDTAEVVDTRPTWTRDDALTFIESVRAELEYAGGLTDRQRAVLEVAVDLAAQYGTTRPVIPVRALVDRLAARSVVVTRMTAHRELMRLAEDGEWLALAQRGDRQSGRANLYQLAPALARTHMGATPPESHPVPMSHPPMSHDEGAPEMTITFTLTPAERAAVFRALAEVHGGPEGNVSEAPVAVGGEAGGNVIPLHGAHQGVSQGAARVSA